MIWRQFMDRVAMDPGKEAFVVADRGVTYREVAALATALAERFPEAAAPRPRPWRALIRDRAPLSLILHVLACWKRGFVPVVLRDGMTEGQIADISSWLRPAAVFLEGLRTEAPLARPRSERSEPQLSARDEALVICTSGTTGAPKLVALPAGSVCMNATTIGTSLGLGAGDRVAVNTPLGYMYGMMGGCIASLWAGATCYLFRSQEPLTQLQAAIRRHRITVVQGPPSLFRLFMAYWTGAPFTSVRMVTTAGEPLAPDLMEAMRRAFPNARKLFLYGMTEAGPRISHEPFETGGGVDGCVGVPYPHVEWRIDPIAEASSLSESGRFVLRGPTVFLGYITANGSYEGLDAAGFFHSSDLMSIGRDGRLHFRGRMDRMFKSGGKLVDPEAVEQVLRMHIDVRDALCFAEQHSILGLVPVAEIVTTMGAAADEAVLLRLCQEHLEPHAKPRRIVRVASWALSESGKRTPSGDARTRRHRGNYR